VETADNESPNSKDWLQKTMSNQLFIDAENSPESEN
jgi:hypothetical protein